MAYSILIVTRNRPKHLARLLSYLSAADFSGPVYVGDASNTIIQPIVASIANAASRSLSVRFTAYHSDAPFLDRLCEEQGRVTTPFVAWCGDDDFLVPNALDLQQRTLEQDQEACAAMGRTLLFAVPGDQASGSIARVASYDLPRIAGNTAGERLVSYLRRPIPLTYSLRRTEVAQRLLTKLNELTFPSENFFHFFFEYIDGAITVIAGHVHRPDGLSIIRQAHEFSTAASLPKMKNPFAIVTHPGCGGFFDDMLKLFHEELSAASQAPGPLVTSEVMRSALWARMAYALQKSADAQLSNLGMRQDGQGSKTRHPTESSGFRRIASWVRILASLGYQDSIELWRIRAAVRRSDGVQPSS